MYLEINAKTTYNLEWRESTLYENIFHGVSNDINLMSKI
jgi:hypothetical protein